MARSLVSLPCPLVARSLVSLPCPLLARILQLLPLEDRRQAVLVCVHMARAGCNPLVWADVVPPRHLVQAPGGLTALLTLHRLELLRGLHLQEAKLLLPASLSAVLLRWVNDNSCLQHLDLSGSDLSGVPAYPLASTMCRIPSLSLSNTHFTLEQGTSLLSHISSRRQARRTRHLDLSYNPALWMLDSGLLVSAVSCLASLDLSYTDLGDCRTMAMMEGVSASRLATIDLSGCRLAKTSLDSIGLNQHLASITMAEVTLCTEKLDIILTNLSLVRNLGKLDLSRTVLTEADPVLLADCSKRVARVELAYCWLYRDHIEFLLDGVTEEGALTQVLELSGNHLEEVSSDLLLEGAARLSSLGLQWSNLQESQLACLLEEEREGEVVLSGRELQALHPSLYRQALGRKGVRLAREGSHEAPSTVLTEE